MANANNFNPRTSYRWNPYSAGEDTAQEQTVESIQIPLFTEELAPDEWILDNCPIDALPADPVSVFIAQMFNGEPKRVLAIIAWIAGISMFAPKSISRRGILATVIVAREDAPKLLRLNKKLQCEVNTSGDRVVRMSLDDSGICPARSPSANSSGNQRVTGIPQGPIVIELSDQSSAGSHCGSGSRSPTHDNEKLSKSL